MNRKASLQDAIFMPMFILVIGITAFIAFYIWSNFSTTFQTITNSTASNQTINAALADIQVGFNTIDYMFPFIVGGLLIVSMIFAFKTGASVIYAFLSIIFWGFALMMSVIFTNIFGTFQDTFPEVALHFPILIWIMNNMKWIVLIWAFLISVVMFSRNQREDQMLAMQGEMR